MPSIGNQTADQYLDNILDLLQERAYPLRDSLDWDVLRQKARIMMTNHTEIHDTHRVIRMVLENLGYPQTCFVPPSENSSSSSEDSIIRFYGLGITPDELHIAYMLPGSPAEDVDLQPGDKIIGLDYMYLSGDQLILPDLKNPVDPLRLTIERSATRERIITIIPPRPAILIPPQTQVIDNIGYIEMVELPDPKQCKEYIASAYQEMDSIRQEHTPKRWVIDLRRNTGEDPGMLLAALHPFLGDQDIGHLQGQDGNSHAWHCHDNQIYFGEEQVAVLPENRPELNYSDHPVALLTSSITHGAAEMALIAFCGREKTRRFGEATSGTPLYYEHFSLVDGASLNVATHVPVDRTGEQYISHIQPDEAIPINWQEFNTQSDPVLQAALSWLKQQH